MLGCRLTPMLPAMTLAEAIETTRIHRVAGLTGNSTALLTTHPCHSSHQTISDADLIGGGYGQCRARCCWPTMACSSWMNGQRCGAISSWFVIVQGVVR
jgi:Magnesium chelatase, subunit ChlI